MIPPKYTAVAEKMLDAIASYELGKWLVVDDPEHNTHEWYAEPGDPGSPVRWRVTSAEVVLYAERESGGHRELVAVWDSADMKGQHDRR